MLVCSIAIHNFFIRQLMSGQLVELPTILDSFTDIANTTSTSIGLEGGGTREPYGGRVKLHPLFKCQMILNDAIFISTYHTKQLRKSNAIFISQSYELQLNCSSLFAYQGEAFTDHLRACGHLTNLRNKPQQKQIEQI